MEKNNVYKDRVSYKERYVNERAIARYRKDEVLSILLDSSLITQSKQKVASLKIVDCGDYKQVYYYSMSHIKEDKNLELMKDVNKSITFLKDNLNDIDTFDLCKYYYFKNNYYDRLKNAFELLLTDFNTFKYDVDYMRFIHLKINKQKLVEIEKSMKVKKISAKNLARAKFSLQRLVKCNESEFKTFITLTFADNIHDVEYTNKIFNVWRRNIKRLKNDFKYVCVPEFQKRGAVHYHLLTNIDYNDFTLLSQEERHIYNTESGWQIGRDIKGWIYGHNMAKNMENIDVVGYLTKYMTKDIDNRLFGHRRYLYSQNLRRSSSINIDLYDLKDFKRYIEVLNEEYEEVFYHNYNDKFYKEKIKFVEYKKKENLL